MRFKVKNIPLATGATLVVFINTNDAKMFDLHLGDRVRIQSRKKEFIAAVDYADDNFIRQGMIGLSEEDTNLLGMGARDGYVNLTPAPQPASLKFIKRKLAGHVLTKDQLTQIVKDIVNNELTDIELTYFVAATYSHELTIEEIAALTNSIVNTGLKLNLGKEPILDKHCIGGVPGNRTTMIVVPIIAAAGLTIPKTSSRAITSPAGTADTVEVFTNVSITLEKMRSIVKKYGGCLAWGGSLNLAPADDKIIRVEHPLSIDAPGMLLSSVLAKKKSVGATHVLIDIPWGAGTKMETREEADHLKGLFEILCKKLGMKYKILLTDGSQPIGNGIGPLLEALDVLKVLKNENGAPQDLKEKSIYLAGELLNLSGKTRNGHALARRLLDSGEAYKKFMQIIRAQGEKKLPAPARYDYEIRAERAGTIKAIRNTHISRMAVLCGAPKTKEAGLYIHKKRGERVKKGELLLTLYANDKNLLTYAASVYEKGQTIVIS